MAEVAALCSNCPIDEMVSQISEALPAAKVMAIKQVVKGRMETLELFNKVAYGLSGLVVLVGAFGLNLLPFKKLERFVHAFSGLAIFLCGCAIQFLGL